MFDEKINYIDVVKNVIIDNFYPDIKNRDEIYIVWFSKTLQNFKALVGATRDNFYYEVTYNGDKKELYIDSYVKFENRVVSMEIGETDA